MHASACFISLAVVVASRTFPPKKYYHNLSPPIGREEIGSLCKSWGIAIQDRMDVRIQGHVLWKPALKHSKGTDI